MDTSMDMIEVMGSTVMPRHFKLSLLLTAADAASLPPQIRNGDG